MNRQIELIPLNLIMLDQANVRFGGDVALNQREALELLMADPDDAKKLLRLAEHISINGLDPTELQMVTPAGDGTFIVLEGNRRLAALKLLQTPDLCTDEKLLKSFFGAQANLINGLPEKIQCSVIPTREAGDIWVELKHTGQNNGVGRVGWDSDIRDERRARQTGIESIGRQVRLLVKNNLDVFSQDNLTDMNNIPVTTLTRLFSSTPAQSLFKLSVSNKILVPTVDIKFIAPSVAYAAELFSRYSYNVNDIRDDSDRKRFLEKIPLEITPEKLIESSKSQSFDSNKGNTSDVNDSSRSGAQSHEENSDFSESKPQVEQAGNNEELGADSIKDEKQARARPSSRARKYLIPWSLSINKSRINQIYRELRKDIEVDRCPNATAIAFRVFIEVTCDDFVAESNAGDNPVLRVDNKKPVTIDDTLETKVKAVAQHLMLQKLIHKDQFKAIMKRASTHDQVGSVDHFNQFIHSASTPPIPSELKDIADEYRPMFEAIWK